MSSKSVVIIKVHPDPRFMLAWARIERVDSDTGRVFVRTATNLVLETTRANLRQPTIRDLRKSLQPTDPVV